MGRSRGVNGVSIEVGQDSGRIKEGLRLVTLGAMILAPTGDAHFNNIKYWIDGQASDLGYTKKQFDAMTQELQKVCQNDQGKSLIEAAFGED